jgi:excisionase family DNA binding protein
MDYNSLAGFAPDASPRVAPAQPHDIDPAELGIPRVLYSLREARSAFGFSRSYLYQLIAAGELRSLKTGKTRRVLAVDLARFIVARLEAAR